MARFRILQRPSALDPSRPRFDVQQKVWWWWQHVTIGWTIEEAEQLLFEIENNPVETKVIKEYN